MKNIISLILTTGLLCACTPSQSNRGNLVEDFRLKEVTPGVSTRTNVLKSLGSPTTVAPFNNNVWYYIGQKMEKTGIFDPEVVDEKIIVVAFDDKGILQTIDERDADRINVPTVRRKTHTGGNDISIVEQLLGNVGRFNSNENTSAARTAGGGDL